jgi:hypothetical protein
MAVDNMFSENKKEEFFPVSAGSCHQFERADEISFSARRISGQTTHRSGSRPVDTPDPDAVLLVSRHS